MKQRLTLSTILIVLIGLVLLTTDKQTISCETTSIVMTTRDSLLTHGDSLDLDTNIVHWEVWNDTLYIYTKEDSIRDEIKRIRYIQSLDKECLDLTGTTQGEYTYEEQLSIEPDYIYYDTNDVLIKDDSVIQWLNE